MLFSDIKFNFSEIIENSLSEKILAWCYLVISDFTFSYILTGYSSIGESTESRQ